MARTRFGPGTPGGPGPETARRGRVGDVLRCSAYAAADEETARLGAGALAAASCISASWLTLAVSSASADSSEWRLETPALSSSSSSTASFTASFMSVSTSLARSRMSSTKSLVSSTMSSMNRVKVFLRFDMGDPFGRQMPLHLCFSLTTQRVTDGILYTLRKECQVG